MGPRLWAGNTTLHSEEMGGFSQWFAAGRTKGVIQASNRWLPGGGKWRVLPGGQHAAPVGGLSLRCTSLAHLRKTPLSRATLVPPHFP